MQHNGGPISFADQPPSHSSHFLVSEGYDRL